MVESIKDRVSSNEEPVLNANIALIRQRNSEKNRLDVICVFERYTLISDTRCSYLPGSREREESDCEQFRDSKRL